MVTSHLTIAGAIRLAATILVIALSARAQEAGALARASHDAGDAPLALLLARKACLAADTPDTRTALYAALARTDPLPFDADGANWGCGMPWVADTVFTLDAKTLHIWRRDGTGVAQVRGEHNIRWWAFAYGGDRVALCRHGEHDVKLYDLGGRLLASLDHEEAARVAGPFPGADACPEGVWIAEKGRFVVTWGRQAHLWSGDDGAYLTALRHGAEEVLHAFPRDDGRKVFTSTAEAARIFDRGGKLLAVWTPPHPITGVRWATKRGLLLTRDGSADARLWNEEGQEVAVLGGHADEVTSARFSNSLEMIVTASKDGNVVLRTARGDALRVLHHPCAVHFAGFLPGDRHLVTACADGVVRLYSRRGFLLAELRGHTRAVNNVGYSRRGDLLLTAGDDGSVRQWPVRLEDALAEAARRAGRELTPEEKGRYGG